MEISFTHHGHHGRVIVSVATTSEPAVLGARDGAIGLANCTATIEFAGRGYLQLLGWVQLVRSSDNAFHGRQFEMDPFDPFGLYQHAPSPYCWYGIAPTLFDAPARETRLRLDWVAPATCRRRHSASGERGTLGALLLILFHNDMALE